MIDNADRKRLVKYFGVPTIFDNRKPDINLIKVFAPQYINEFAMRGYIYSEKEKVWVFSLLNRSLDDELAWINTVKPQAIIETANTRSSVVNSNYICILGQFNALHEKELIDKGFHFDTKLGWISKVKARDVRQLELYLKSKNVRYKMKTVIPERSVLANAHLQIAQLGSTTNETCPHCGSQLEERISQYGKYKYCSKFLLGCNYQISSCKLG